MAVVFFLSMFHFFFERLKMREGQREGDRGSEMGLCADTSEPDVGLELVNPEIMT